MSSLTSSGLSLECRQISLLGWAASVVPRWSRWRWSRSLPDMVDLLLPGLMVLCAKAIRMNALLLTRWRSQWGFGGQGIRALLCPWLYPFGRKCSLRVYRCLCVLHWEHQVPSDSGHSEAEIRAVLVWLEWGHGLVVRAVGVLCFHWLWLREISRNLFWILEIEFIFEFILGHMASLQSLSGLRRCSFAVPGSNSSNCYSVVCYWLSSKLESSTLYLPSDLVSFAFGSDSAPSEDSRYRVSYLTSL